MLLANGFEESEAVIVIDLLRRAGYDVKLVSITHDKEVTSSHNLKFITDSTLESEDFANGDAIFLPGGSMGVDNLAANKKVLEIVKEYHNKNKYIIAICAAPYVLEIAGILNGKRVTSYPATKEKLKSIKEYSENKVVIDGKLITSRAFGTSIDLGLALIELFSGEKEKDKIKKAIVY